MRWPTGSFPAGDFARPGSCATRTIASAAAEDFEIERTRSRRPSPARLPRFLVNELPDPRRRERQLARLCAERAERGGDRVGNDAADRDDAAFARALGAERIVGRGLFLERDRPDVRKIARRR